MPPDALISAPIIVAAVFVASAVGKLADPRRAALAFDALHVPRPLARPWMRTAHPWAELLLALCLVMTSGSVAVATALVTTALAVVYLVLVIRALQRPEPIDCACFGAVVNEQVSRWTVLRNAWLLGLSVVCVWSALGEGSPVQRALSLGEQVWWLAALVAAATMTALILHPGSPTLAAGPAASVVDSDGDLEDYARTEIPHVPVTLSDGSMLSLRELAASRPKLILAVSGVCASCLPTIEAAPEWRERLPEVDVHLLYASPPAPPTATRSEPQSLHDPDRFAIQALGLEATPSAVLLGADGMLAGGPVVGHDAISMFVTDAEAELEVARVSQH